MGTDPAHKNSIGKDHFHLNLEIITSIKEWNGNNQTSKSAEWGKINWTKRTFEKIILEKCHIGQNSRLKNITLEKNHIRKDQIHLKKLDENDLFQKEFLSLSFFL